LTMVGSALGLALHGDPDTYRYIPESIRNYPGAHAVARMMEQHGFEQVRVLPVLGGLMAIHVARRS
jgi:ubiquinone/menaquinone biosynthesis C-methylase UbiE